MSSTKTVLIIDDDQDFVSAVAALLEKRGHRVECSNTGTNGLAKAKTLRPDLILLDVMMTERSEGFYVLSEMRRVPGLLETPIIIVSSIYTEFPRFRVMPDAGWLPADQFLPKPVDPAVLLAEVERLMRPGSLPRPSVPGRSPRRT